MIRTDRLALLSENDLRMLNKAIVEEINRRVKERRAEVAQSLKVGDFCFFTDSTGKPRYIKLTKVNTATVSGIEYDASMKFSLHYKWKVGVTALSKVSPDELT